MLKLFPIIFCLNILSAFGADLELTKKFSDAILEDVAFEFIKLSPQKTFKKFKIYNRQRGESSLAIIRQMTMLNFNSNKIFQNTIQIEELKYSNEILVALSSLFTSIYDAGEEQVETNSLSRFEGFLVERLVNTSYRLFSSWSEAETNSCYGFYIESKKTKEVLALGNCF